MNNDLMQRLLDAEIDFIDALKDAPRMLAPYRQKLSALPDMLSNARKTGSVDNETLYLAHSVASRIADLASCFLDIRRGEEFSTASLRSDCDVMLHRMATLNLSADPNSSQPHDRNDRRCSRSRSNTPISNTNNSTSPFLASAHRWLLDNLHNPYPTAEVKSRIAAVSYCQVSSVNSWFVNARRRIGWTALCRERFSNCRADMIDAAYRALVEEDPQRALPPDLRHSFIAMKVAAEGLYPSSLARSTFAGDLDALIKDMMQKDGEFGGCSQVERANLTKKSRDSYPPPDQSVPASPVPALVESVTDESEEEEDVAPPVIAGSKRRRSSVEPVNESSCVSKPIKRLRTSTTFRAHLPSPLLTTDSTSDDGSPNPSPVYPTQCETTSALPSRKRRLSDVDTMRIPKRPCSSMAGPHLHSVSDPLPRTSMENEYSIDDWLNTNFDTLFAIPPPVDATIEPDLSASCEVELFRDYNIPGESIHTTKPSACTQISAPTDLSHLDNLLHSIGGDAFITPLHNAPASDVTDVLHTSFDSSIFDISQTNIDWTSLLTDTEVYQPTTYATFSQFPTDSQPLPEIDLSVLQLPYVIPAVSHQEDFASKQAKLYQLQVMQEAVRRMEQELQAEGIAI